MKKHRAKPPRNPHARALRSYAGNASVPASIDARPKIARPRKGKGSYRRSQVLDNRSEHTASVAWPSRLARS